MLLVGLFKLALEGEVGSFFLGFFYYFCKYLELRYLLLLELFKLLIFLSDDF